MLFRISASMRGFTINPSFALCTLNILAMFYTRGRVTMVER
jgi:hypothetical protein